MDPFGEVIDAKTLVEEKDEPAMGKLKRRLFSQGTAVVQLVMSDQKVLCRGKRALSLTKPRKRLKRGVTSKDIDG